MFTRTSVGRPQLMIIKPEGESQCNCESRSTSPTGAGGRRHYREFCHCNCTCIHKCHHLHKECATDEHRMGSPKMSPNILRASSSLASVLEEMESGKLHVTGNFGDINGVGKPRRLGDFCIERDLGEGAYAFVKQVRYRNMSVEGDNKSMVMKMVIKSKLLPEFILHDFESGLSLPVELYALRHLREHPHPNVVSMVDAFEDPMYYYLLMPLHGNAEDLFEIIEKHDDFLPTDKIAKIFAQVVMAVAHLHNVLGIAHRDIKDENIIIDEHDRIQLIDFGSCTYFRRGDAAQLDIPPTVADVQVGRRLNQYHRFYGTVDYAPPEVVKGEAYEGPPQDIWALGILLYILSFKEVPFRNFGEILELRLVLPFEPTPQIAFIIRQLLQPDPAARPTAKDLVNDPWIVENYRLAMETNTTQDK